MKTYRLLIIAVLTCILPVTASAQKLIDSADGFKMTLKLDHPDAIYAVGEEIKAEFTMTLNGEPYDGPVKWKMSKDYYKPSEKNGTVNLEGGKTVMTCSLDEPGFIHIRYTFKTPQGNTISQMVGAAVDPYKIERSMPVP